MTTLTELANRYQSDKGTQFSFAHGFSKVYDKHFSPIRDEKLNILEIGVHDGCSLKMWEEFFPNATILGLDIEDKSEFNTSRVSCAILDQSEQEDLDMFAQSCELEYDIIIDDGSHHMEDQQITFGAMFPLLKSGGMYVIEDLHTSITLPGTMIYERPVDIHKDKGNTTLHFLQNLMHKNSRYLTEETNQYLRNHVSSVDIFDLPNDRAEYRFFGRSITSIIKKK